jgi:hypothetical protein
MPEFLPQGGSGRTAGRSHETKDMRLRLVLLFGLALTATLVGSHYGLRAVFARNQVWADRKDRPRSPLREARVAPPEPRLQTQPAADLEQLRRDEERRLDSYGWIDREHRILRMPIDRAMDLMIQRGGPGKTPPRSAD